MKDVKTFQEAFERDEMKLKKKKVKEKWEEKINKWKKGIWVT